MRRRPPKGIADPWLASLVPAAGSLQQARNELRWLKQELPEAKVARAVKLRGKYGYPLQYILGSQPFGPLTIQCRRGVLIPRWETEEWVSKLSTLVEPKIRVLDLCTGTGCALFLLAHIKQATGWAVDISPRALQVFELNKVALGFDGAAAAISHSVYDPLPDHVKDVDVVMANPPYITSLSDAEHSVSRFEPRLALLEQPRIYDALIDRVVETTASRAVFEVGSKSQIDLCVDRFTALGWTAHGERDSAGNWRTVWAAK